jgi:Carboxypeptidase regulatory-like domain
MIARGWPAGVALALGIVLTASLVTVGRAAETTGALVLHVLGAKGDAVAAAHAAAVSPSARYDASSDAAGRITFAAMSPDTYAVSVSADRYDTKRIDGVVVAPGGHLALTVTMTPALVTIGRVATGPTDTVAAGRISDTYTVTGDQARGPATANASGLGTYLRGTVQSAIARVPGVQQDPFANAIIRGGKVDDVVFSYDAVPLPQALIAEPGGNVIGAQLATTGLGYTSVTTGGFTTGADDALGGTVDQTPLTGTYPGRTTLTTGVGLFPGARTLEVQRLWAAPSLRQRYAVDASIGSQSIAYGDGHTFYPAEAATYGLSLATRATWSASGNVHLQIGQRDDLEIAGLAGEATYDQYGTPFAGQTYGAFDGNTSRYPGEPSPDAAVNTPTRVRGTYSIEKLQLLRSYDHSYARVRLYRSQYGAATDAPFFDDLSFPNGVVSYFGRQSGTLTGVGFDAMNLAGARHQLSYGVELRRQTSTLFQVVPTLDQTVTANPVLTSKLAYAADEWTIGTQFRVQGALRFTSVHVAPGGNPPYDVAAVDPHLAAVVRLGSSSSLRAAFDHTTVAPKPLQAQRNDSLRTDAPFVALSPERGTSYELAYEHTGNDRLRVTVFSKENRDRIDVIPADFRATPSAGSSPGTGIGVPENVGSLLANGIEAAYERGPFSFSSTYVRARSSSASQFGLNNLNAPAIAANHLFPVGYVPDLSAIASYRVRFGAVIVRPALSWESGYPYGNGRKVWVYDASGKPTQTMNDNHVNPGANYYFLRDPGQAYDPVTNPVVASLGTPEGDDPNTLRSTPHLSASVHLETPLSRRVLLSLDVTNLFGTSTPTQLQSNPYLIGPPGYTGGNAAYAAWYGAKFNGTPYALGNGVPTNDGLAPIVPWTYGTAGYVPSSYPEARSVYLQLRVQI